MTDKHTIEVIIDQDGNLTATVQGIQGAKCSEISKWLDKLGEVTEDRKTPDFHQSRHTAQNVRR